MKKLIVIFLAAGLMASMALFSLGHPVSAHGTTQVGDYTLVIGFHDEPVYVGVPNALDLFVTNFKTNTKVNGLETTLKVEIIFGSSKKELTLVPQEDTDGAYTAYVLPTRAGDYTWHIFGTIENTLVDVSMTSSPTTFDSADALSSIAFPDSSASSTGSSGGQTALIVGGVGVVLGLAGLLFGLIAWRKTTRIN
jgi:hypothetical protein